MNSLSLIHNTNTRRNLFGLRKHMLTGLRHTLQGHRGHDATNVHHKSNQAGINTGMSTLSDDYIKSVALSSVLGIANSVQRTRHRQTTHTNLSTAMNATTGLTAPLLSGPPAYVNRAKISARGSRTSLPSPGTQHRAELHTLFAGIYSEVARQNRST